MDDELVICPENPTEIAILEVVGDIEKLTDFSVGTLSKNLVLKSCKKAYDDGISGIRVLNGKIKFSEFSDRYSVSDPLFFCKIKTGYKHYLSRLEGKVRHFYNRISEEKNRVDQIRHDPGYKNKDGTSEIRVSWETDLPLVGDEEKLWECIIPTYIRSKKILNFDEKVLIENIYKNTSCTPIE